MDPPYFMGISMDFFKKIPSNHSSEAVLREQE
jgi:hypothetical protein